MRTPLYLVPILFSVFTIARGDEGAAGAKDILVWHDATGWGVEGRAWEDRPRTRWFDRLPSDSEKAVGSKIWELSHDSAGMVVRFESDSPKIEVRYKLLKTELTGYPNQTATGASGVDLYARDSSNRWRWVNVAFPEKQDVQATLMGGAEPKLREFALYLPLQNGVESLEIGVTQSSVFKGLAPRASKPIVFYGTSINHGYTASRPGMTHIAILGRRFDRPVINLGFGGQGRMDAAVGDLLSDIDAAVYVIDCLPNMSPAEVTERCIPLVKQLRAKRPLTPIVLVEDRRLSIDWFVQSIAKFHDANHAALKAAFEALRASGENNLFYIKGDRLLGEDGEATTDTSHPSDLGFMRMADVMEPTIAEALQVSVRTAK